MKKSDKINAALRTTGQFDGNKSIPLWARFVNWRLMPQVELESTFQEAQSYIFESHEIKPGPYLHVAHDQFLLPKMGPETEPKLQRRSKIESRSSQKVTRFLLLGLGETTAGTMKWAHFRLEDMRSTQTI